MQQSVVPQVGVVQSVLGSFAVVPEGQEKLTLPQVALTVRGYRHPYPQRLQQMPSLPFWADGHGRTPQSGQPPNIKKEMKEEKRNKKESSEDRILLKLPVKRSRGKKRRGERESEQRTNQCSSS